MVFCRIFCLGPLSEFLKHRLVAEDCIRLCFSRRAGCFYSVVRRALQTGRRSDNLDTLDAREDARVIYHRMDAETILQLWRDIDTDNDGKITREQLKAGLRQSGVPFSEKGLSKVMR